MKKKLRLKNWYCFLLILFFYGTNYPLIYSEILKNNEDKIDNLSIDYLKRLPENDYILGPGDELRVIVSRDYEELVSITKIDGEGTIYLPKLKRIYVNELSLNELNLLLNKAYKKFVKYPEVEVEIITYRPLRVFVEGEVQNPGLITLAGSLVLRQNDPIDFNSQIKNNQKAAFNFLSNTSNDSNKSNYFPTVFDAIRQSGGVTKYSDLAEIQIIRKANLSNGSGRIAATLNLENVLITGDNTQNIRIYDSDVIKVKKSNNPNNNLFYKGVLSNLNPKFLNVFVFGRVNNPGNIKVSRLGALSDAIEIAGGARVVRGPLTFLRFNNDGTIDKRKFRYTKNAKRGSFKNPYLEEADLIVVGNSALSSANEIVTEITSPFVGIFSTYGLIKAIND